MQIDKVDSGIERFHYGNTDDECVVLNLKEQTEKIGSDAANLTKALKGDRKMNWNA